jgi:hypothetical protein
MMSISGSDPIPIRTEVRSAQTYGAHLLAPRRRAFFAVGSNDQPLLPVYLRFTGQSLPVFCVRLRAALGGSPVTLLSH